MVKRRAPVRSQFLHSLVAMFANKSLSLASSTSFIDGLCQQRFTSLQSTFVHYQ